MTCQAVPLVSVIVPAYNVERCLAATVASASGQTMADLEILIANDGSTDGTLEVALHLARSDQRVRVLHSRANRGAAAARNAARAAARGVWLAALDADDSWLPNRLEALLGTPGADTADVIADDVYRVEPADGSMWSCLLHRWQAPLRLDGPTRLTTTHLFRHHLGVLQPLIRRSFLNKYGIVEDQTLPFAEDFYLSLDLLLAGAAWLQVPEGYYLYIARPGSLTTRYLQHGQAVLDRHVARLRDPRIARDATLRAAFEHFILEERASLLAESARLWLRQPSRLVREPGMLVRALGSPDLLVPVLAHVLRRLTALGVRRRAGSSSPGGRGGGSLAAPARARLYHA